MDYGVKAAICIPYYKKFEALKRLLESIVNQTFGEYVVIVTDDSSDTRAQEYLAQLDSRFVYFCNHERLGSTKNCNRAMELARSYTPEYIKVMHHDDYFSYEKSLQEFVDLLDHNPEAVFAFSGARIDVNDGKKVYETAASQEQLDELQKDKYCILETNFIGNPSAVIMRNVGIGMDANLIWLVDIDWFMKLLEYQECFAFTPDALVGIGFDGDNLTDYCLKDLDLQQKEFLYVYMKHSEMQDFSYLGRIIEICAAYYKKEKGFWHKEDYQAIVKDAICDGRKLCLWGTDKAHLRKGYEGLRQQGWETVCCLGRDAEEQEIIDGDIPWIDFERLKKDKRNYLCIIMQENAKAARKLLAEKGINSLPYIERFLTVQ